MENNIPTLYILQRDSYVVKSAKMFKDAVKSVLRIGSAHNKGGTADINIAQISHLSNFSDIKLWFIY